MNVNHQVKMRILSSPVSLGRSCIYADTVKLDGGNLPGWLTLDDRAGTVQRTAPTDDDLTAYTVDYTCFVSALAAVSADKSQVAADGLEEITLTVTCEDMAETGVPVAVFCEGDRVGVIDVPMTNGQGSIAVTVAVPGTYRYQIDDTVDETWGVPWFIGTGQAVVEAVEP